MNSLASKAHFRQRVIEYSEKNGVTKAAIRYRVSRNTIYRWKSRYDGSWKSLVDRSHRPLHHPREHSQEEYDLIRRYWYKNKEDRMILWMKIREQGYKRSYKSMCRAIKRMQLNTEIERRQRYKPKPYAQAEYPGQKVQIDVKYVPTYCTAGGEQYYQYTAIDECTRYTYREMYDEHSTYSSWEFIRNVIKHFPFKIETVQTDNGTEWTNALISDKPKPTLFEEALEEAGITYKRIRVATPRHNGKVERQHREDEKRFYRNARFYSLEDGRTQLKRYNRFSNTVPKTCLAFLSPKEVLEKHLSRPE